MAEYRDEYIADVAQYVRDVHRGADAADDFKDKQEKAALAARKMAVAANEAGDKASRAQRKAADAASVYEHAAKQAADAAQALARGEIKEAEAAKVSDRAARAQARATDAATRAMREKERADIAAVSSAMAAAKAIDHEADQYRQLARDAEVAAAGQRLAALAAGKGSRKAREEIRLLAKAFPELAKTANTALDGMEKTWAATAQEMASTGPVGLIAAVAAALIALPAAATVAGAGIGLGIGAGFAGGAIAIAAQNEKVKRQFTGLGRYVMADLKSWSVPYEGVLIRTASRAGDAFDELGPHIKAAFAGLAPDIERFAQAALAAFGNLGPYIDRGVKAFHPLMTILSARLPGMIENVANQLTRMTESADPRAWDQLLGGFNGLISGAGNVVVALEKIDSAYLALEGHSRAAEAEQAGRAEIWHKIGERLGIVNPKVAELVPLTNSAASGMRKFGNAAEAAAEKTREWHSAVLASYNSELAFRVAVEDASKGIERQKGHIRGWNDLSTHNAQLLLGVANASEQMTEDVRKSGGDVNASMTRGYNAFIKAARGAHLTKAEAAALARQIHLVPGAKTTTFKNNASSAASRVAYLQRIMNNIPRQIATTIAVNLAYSGLSQNTGAGNRARHGRASGGYVGYADGGFVEQAQAAMDAVRRFPTGGPVSGPGTGSSDSIPAYLSNGEYVVNAMATREFRSILDAINFGRGRSAPAASSMTRSGGATVVNNVYLTVHGSVISERKLIETVRQGLAQRSVSTPGRNGTIAPRAA